MKIFFSIFFTVCGAATIFAFLLLHSAACGLHVAAVDLLRSHPGHEHEYVISYNYCKPVSGLSRWVRGMA